MSTLTIVVLGAFFVFVGFVALPYIKRAMEDNIIEERPVMGVVVRRTSPELTGESWAPNPHFRGIPPHELGPLPAPSQHYRLWVQYEDDTTRFIVSPEYFAAHERGATIWLMRVRRRTLIRGNIVTDYYLAAM